MTEPLAARLAALIHAGDTVWWGQATAEPLTLTRALVAHRKEIAHGERLRIFVGIGGSDTLKPEQADTFDFFGYTGGGPHRKLADAGVLDILPLHYSQIPHFIDNGALPADVVLLQVSPPDARGRYSLSQVREYLPAAVRRARVVIGEVNPDVPWTRGGVDLGASDFALLIDAQEPPLSQPAGAIGPEEQAISRHVAGLIEDGATLQLGIGKLPEAILAALKDHKDLGLHSGVVADGIVDLAEAGVLTNARKTVDPGVAVGGILMGTGKLRRWAHQNPHLQLRETEYTHNAAVLAASYKPAAINSAIEVDLTGQINAEVAAGTYVGAVGGAVDFLRGAAASPGGLPIVALPSATRKGVSRIVAQLSGPVSTARSDAGLIVTEHGVADLRGQPLSQRVRRMIAIAAPEFRATLEREAHTLLRRAGAAFPAVS